MKNRETESSGAIIDQQEVAVTTQSGSDYGQIKINNNVIAIIAHETAKKVPGVVELSGSLADGIVGMIGKKNKDRGIRIEKESEELLTIDLTVVLEYGVCIPEICVQLQSAVKKAVETMTGQQVYSVNVVVQGIKGPSEKNNED